MSRVHAVDCSLLLVYLFNNKAIPWGDRAMGKDKKSRNFFSGWQLILSTVLFPLLKKGRKNYESTVPDCM